MEIPCPSCGRALTVSNHVAGDEIRCPACEHASVAGTSDPEAVRSGGPVRHGAATSSTAPGTPARVWSTWAFLRGFAAWTAGGTAPLGRLLRGTFDFYRGNREILFAHFTDRSWHHGDGAVIRLRLDRAPTARFEWADDRWRLELPKCCAVCGGGGSLERRETEPRLLDVSRTWFVVGVSAFVGFLFALWQGWWVLPLALLLGLVLGYTLRREHPGRMVFHLCGGHVGESAFPDARLLSTNPDVFAVRVGERSVKMRFGGESAPAPAWQSTPSDGRVASEILSGPQPTKGYPETMPLAGDDDEDADDANPLGDEAPKRSEPTIPHDASNDDGDDEEHGWLGGRSLVDDTFPSPYAAWEPSSPKPPAAEASPVPPAESASVDATMPATYRLSEPIPRDATAGPAFGLASPYDVEGPLDAVPRSGGFNVSLAKVYDTIRLPNRGECEACGVLLPLTSDPTAIANLAGDPTLLDQFLQLVRTQLGEAHVPHADAAGKDRPAFARDVVEALRLKPAEGLAVPVCPRCRADDATIATIREVRETATRGPGWRLAWAIASLERGRRSDVARARGTATAIAELLRDTPPHEIRTRTLGAMLLVFCDEAGRHAKRRIPAGDLREIRKSVAGRISPTPHPLVGSAVRRSIARARGERRVLSRQRRPGGVLRGIVLAAMIPPLAYFAAHGNLVERGTALLPVEQRSLVTDVRTAVSPVRERFRQVVADSRARLATWGPPLATLPKRIGDSFPPIILGLLLLPVLVVGLSLLRRLGLLLGGLRADGTRAPLWGRFLAGLLGLATILAIVAAIPLASLLL